MAVCLPWSCFEMMRSGYPRRFEWSLGLYRRIIGVTDSGRDGIRERVQTVHSKQAVQA